MQSLWITHLLIHIYTGKVLNDPPPPPHKKTHKQTKKQQQQQQLFCLTCYSQLFFPVASHYTWVLPCLTLVELSGIVLSYFTFSLPTIFMKILTPKDLRLANAAVQGNSVFNYRVRKVVSIPVLTCLLEIRIK